MSTLAFALVVDDAPLMRGMLAAELRKIGISEVDMAENGKIALELVSAALEKKRPYGIVLLDWNMPELNGLEVLKVIRAKEEMLGSWVVMVTAEGDKENIVAAEGAGADYFISKPFDKVKLGLLIKSLVGKERKVKSKK